MKSSPKSRSAVKKVTKRSPSKKSSGPKLPLKAFLMDTAEAAGDVLVKYFRKVKQIERKPNAGIVTEADKKAEAVILKRILKNFPESSIVTEESGKYAGDDWCWYIDPLDGTSNYAHGFPYFCVSIGLYVGDVPRAGVIWQPLTQEMYYAEAGQGAYLNGKRIHVSQTSDLEDSLLGTGFFYSTGEQLRREMDMFRRVQEKALGVRRPGSAALDLACVAAGRFDGFWERGLAPWDMAAGFILVQEAGGRISRYSGENAKLADAEVLAANPNIYGKLLALLQ